MAAKKASSKKKPAKKAAKKSVKKASKPKAKAKAKSKPKAKKAARKPAPKAAAKPKATAKVLAVGAMAPDFSLQTDTGETIRLSQFAGKTVVLYFYPKDMTPGCTVEACDFRDSYARFTERNAVILGVSKDSVTDHQKFKEKYALPFPLLADVDGKVCEAFGVWQEKALYGRTYMGIARTTFVIGPDRRIVSVFEKVKVEGHSAEVQAALG